MVIKAAALYSIIVGIGIVVWYEGHKPQSSPQQPSVGYCLSTENTPKKLFAAIVIALTDRKSHKARITVN